MASSSSQTPKKKKALDKRVMDNSFLAHGDHEALISTDIVPGSRHTALCAYFANPGEFYVILRDTWNHLEQAMSVYQKEYRGTDATPAGKDCIPKKIDLVPGYIVAAKCCPEDEYHRAKIVGVLPEDFYKVKLLDYGECHDVHYDKLRYMRFRHHYMIKSQAIRCRVALKCVGTSWTEAESRDFLRTIFNRPMAVHFRKMTILEDTCEPVWDVFTHLYSERLRKITDFHVEREVAQKGGRTLTLTEKEEKNTLSYPYAKITPVLHVNPLLQ